MKQPHIIQAMQSLQVLPLVEAKQVEQVVCSREAGLLSMVEK